MRDEDGVVGDALKERGGARVHGEHRGFEAGLAAHIQILQIGESGHVARNDFVAHELLEFGIGDLQRGVDLVAGFVFRSAVAVRARPM